MSISALGQMVVFADSYADTGRKFRAPASHQYEEYGIGPFPWTRLYETVNSDVRCLVYALLLVSAILLLLCFPL